MRAGVEQIFALQVDFCATAMLGETLRKIEFGRAPGELLQVMPQLRDERRILPGLLVSRPEFSEGRHQRLGQNPPAVATKTAAGIRQRETVKTLGVGSGKGHDKSRLSLPGCVASAGHVRFTV